VNPPMDIEGVGRIAFIKDSQGAVFAIIKLINPPEIHLIKNEILRRSFFRDDAFRSSALS